MSAQVRCASPAFPRSSVRCNLLFLAALRALTSLLSDFFYLLSSCARHVSVLFPMLKRLTSCSDLSDVIGLYVQMGKSVSALADDAGVSRQQLYNILQESSANPRLDTLLAVCRALNITVFLTTTPRLYESL